jgi:hypothetical protein
MMDVKKEEILGRPPWRWAPDHPIGSLFWKMGAGEDYLDVWSELFLCLSLEERREYLDRYETPTDWRELISFISGDSDFGIDWGDDDGGEE